MTLATTAAEGFKFESGFWISRITSVRVCACVCVLNKIDLQKNRIRFCTGPGVHIFSDDLVTFFF